jgi:hypothetical protein
VQHIRTKGLGCTAMIAKQWLAEAGGLK